MKLNSIFKIIFGELLYIINVITPKKNNKLTVCVYPELEDTVRALIPYFSSNVVILAKKVRSSNPDWLPSNVRVYKKNSIRGLYHLLTARRIYFTHGIFSFFKLLNEERQLVVNLWHGMSFKNVGLLEGERHVVKSHRTLCTSPFFQKLQAKAFGMTESKVLISGLPRNDLLLVRSSNSYISNLKSCSNNIYVWLPTYRKSKEGELREDGNTESIFAFESFNTSKLNEILVKNGDFLFIKPHPMSFLSVELTNFSNIKLIDEDWLFDKNLTLYELLSASDALWTDYSSVFVDYVLTKKPILFIAPDIEIYKERRGLAFDINIFKLPGVVVREQEELFKVLEKPSLWKKDYDGSLFNSISKFKAELIR